MVRALRSVAGVLVAVLVSGACGGTTATGSTTLHVVAAFYPLAEAARQVGGSNVSVHDVTPAGVEPHDLELKPSDVGRFRSADVIFYLGGHFQPALEDAIEALPDSSNAVDLLDDLPLRAGLDADEPTDPHVWLDPQLMTRIVERIEEELARRLDDARSTLAANRAAYVRSLEELDRDFEGVLATCTRREVVTSHAAFAYLTARYGLEQIPISGITPESEPSPQRLQEVATLAEQRGVTTIYFETLVDPRVAQSIARAVGADTAVLDPIEGLTDEQRDEGETYVTLMLKNLSALAMGLGCKQT